MILGKIGKKIMIKIHLIIRFRWKAVQERELMINFEDKILLFIILIKLNIIILRIITLLVFNLIL